MRFWWRCGEVDSEGFVCVRRRGHWGWHCTHTYTHWGHRPPKGGWPADWDEVFDYDRDFDDF